MFNTHSGRSCARCGKDLTDAASLEAGVGPVCRRLDNHVYATYLMPSMSKVWDVLGTLDPADLAEEARATFDAVMRVVEAALAGEQLSEYRLQVKQLEWVLSHVQRHGHAHGIITDAVEAFGYVGLAAVLRDEAVKGKARVWADGPWLYVSSPRNRYANAKIKTISGRRFVKQEEMPPGTKHGGWKVPTREFKVFKAVILAHFPNHEIQGSATWDDFESFVKPEQYQGEPEVKPESPKNRCRVEDAGDRIMVFTPYNAGFVQAIKMLPYRDRKWNDHFKCWVIAKRHLPEVLKIIEAHCGEKLAEAAA